MVGAPDVAAARVGLVALHVLAYSAQPVLVTMTKTDGGYAYDASSAVLLAEALKLVLAIVSLACGGQQRRLVLDPASPRGGGCCAGASRCLVAGLLRPRGHLRVLRRSLVYAVPAFLYVAHNNLLFLAYLYLSPPLYQLLSNIRIVTMGVVYRLLLHRRLLVVQWVALAQLTAGLACTSLDFCSGRGCGAGRAGASAWLAGAVVVFLTALCSALAGVYTELVIKTSAPLRSGSVWLYAYGVLASALCCLWTRPPGRGLLEGYTAVVWAAVLSNGALGAVVSFVFRHGDNKVKLLGTSLTVLFTIVVSAPLFGFRPGLGLWLGYAVAVCGLLLYYGDQESLYSFDTDVLECCPARSRTRARAHEFAADVLKVV